MNREPMYQRQYDVEGYEEKILLQIFDPKPSEVGNWGWMCEYRLHAPFLEWEAKYPWGGGDDKLDAFSSALVKITIELRSLSRKSGTFVSFMGDRNIDLIGRDFY